MPGRMCDNDRADQRLAESGSSDDNLGLAKSAPIAGARIASRGRKECSQKCQRALARPADGSRLMIYIVETARRTVRAQANVRRLEETQNFSRVVLRFGRAQSPAARNTDIGTELHQCHQPRQCELFRLPDGNRRRDVYGTARARVGHYVRHRGRDKTAGGILTLQECRGRNFTATVTRTPRRLSALAPLRWNCKWPIEPRGDSQQAELSHRCVGRKPSNHRINRYPDHARIKVRMGHMQVALGQRHHIRALSLHSKLGRDLGTTVGGAERTWKPMTESSSIRRMILPSATAWPAVKVSQQPCETNTLAK